MAILDGDLLAIAAEVQYLNGRIADATARLYLANLPDRDGQPIREALTRSRVLLSVATMRLVEARTRQEAARRERELGVEP